MCRHVTFALPPEPRSAGAARMFLQRCLAEWDLAELADEAQISLSELVTNGVLHARTPLVVSVSAEGGHLEVAVIDGSPARPQVRPHRRDLHADLDALLLVESQTGAFEERDPRLDVGEAGSVAGGRGLLLVEALMAEWGVTALHDGKAVWFRTPAPADWPHGAGCDCASGPTTLASGRTVVHRG